MEFFTTPNSKNIIATLRIVTIEKSELTFLLILYFHALNFKVHQVAYIRISFCFIFLKTASWKKNQIITHQIPEEKLKQIGVWNYYFAFSNGYSVLYLARSNSWTHYSTALKFSVAQPKLTPIKTVPAFS